MTALKSWRARMGWTQTQAAEAMGVSKPTYQSWESGKRWSDGTPLPPPKTALLAASALEQRLPPLE